MFVQSGKLVLTRSKPFCHTQSDDHDEDDDNDEDDVDDADFDHVSHGQTPMLFCCAAKSLTLSPYLLFDTLHLKLIHAHDSF